jgi:hypothetical protein
MEPVYNKTKTNETVVMDDHYFVGCVFNNCTIVYCGGEFGWDKCQFNTCRINIQGAAMRVMAFCQTFGIIRAPDQIPANFVPPASTKTN